MTAATAHPTSNAGPGTTSQRFRSDQHTSAALCRGLFNLEASGISEDRYMVILSEDRLECFRDSGEPSGEPDLCVLTSDIEDVEVLDAGFVITGNGGMEITLLAAAQPQRGEPDAKLSVDLEEWITHLSHVCSGHSDHEEPNDTDVADLDVDVENIMRQIFNVVDKDCSGYVNKREFIQACRSNAIIASFFGLPQQLRQTQVGEVDGPRTKFERVFQGLDGDGDRQVSWEEFYRFFTATGLMSAPHKQIEVLHEGALLIRRSSEPGDPPAAVEHVIAYTDRVEYYADAAAAADGGAKKMKPHGTILTSDMQSIVIQDNGFMICTDDGTLQLQTLVRGEINTWIDAIRWYATVMKLEGGSTSAPVSRGSTSAPVSRESTSAPMTTESKSAPMTTESKSDGEKRPMPRESTSAPMTRESTSAPMTRASTSVPMTRESSGVESTSLNQDDPDSFRQPSEPVPMSFSVPSNSTSYGPCLRPSLSHASSTGRLSHDRQAARGVEQQGHMETPEVQQDSRTNANARPSSRGSRNGPVVTDWRNVEQQGHSANPEPQDSRTSANPRHSSTGNRNGPVVRDWRGVEQQGQWASPEPQEKTLQRPQSVPQGRFRQGAPSNHNFHPTCRSHAQPVRRLQPNGMTRPIPVQGTRGCRIEYISEPAPPSPMSSSHKMGDNENNGEVKQAFRAKLKRPSNAHSAPPRSKAFVPRVANVPPPARYRPSAECNKSPGPKQPKFMINTHKDSAEAHKLLHGPQVCFIPKAVNHGESEVIGKVNERDPLLSHRQHEAEASKIHEKVTGSTRMLSPRLCRGDPGSCSWQKITITEASTGKPSLSRVSSASKGLTGKVNETNRVPLTPPSAHQPVVGKITSQSTSSLG